MSAIHDKTTAALASSINFRLLRNDVVSANIANAETPGYKAKKVDFENALARAVDLNGINNMDSNDPDHVLIGSGRVANVRADVYENPVGNITNDGNTVDLEKEMAKLAENTILYKAALRLISKKLGQMKYAISEGR